MNKKTDNEPTSQKASELYGWGENDNYKTVKMTISGDLYNGEILNYAGKCLANVVAGNHIDKIEERDRKIYQSLDNIDKK